VLRDLDLGERHQQFSVLAVVIRCRDAFEIPLAADASIGSIATPVGFLPGNESKEVEIALRDARTLVAAGCYLEPAFHDETAVAHTEPVADREHDGIRGVVAHLQCEGAFLSCGRADEGAANTGGQQTPLQGSHEKALLQSRRARNMELCNMELYC